MGFLYAEDHNKLFKQLQESYCLRPEDILFVNNIAGWCRQQGIQEPDRERPLKLVTSSPQGCKMLISRVATDQEIEQRINALRIRNQLNSATEDLAERLNSDRKKFAYLFLAEYAASLPEIGQDELLADVWAFKEMERLNFFKA